MLAASVATIQPPERSKEHLPRYSLIKIPAQDRSVRMVHSILDAAQERMLQGNFAVLTTNDIAADAGISIGSLYQYFANVEMIFSGVIERGINVMGEHVDGFVQTALDRPARGILLATTHGMVDFAMTYRDTFTQVLVRTPSYGPGSIAGHIERALMPVIQTYLAANSGRYQVEGGDVALYVALNSGILTALKWICEQPADVSRSELCGAIVHQLMAVVIERPAS